jgi:cysteine-rich repeat protein
MKFHQGLAGLLTLLMPVTTVCDTLCNSTRKTKWGCDMTPDDDPQAKKLKAAAMKFRILEDAHPDRALDEQNNIIPPVFTEADFCGGRPITRTIKCGGKDIIELELKNGTNYVIDVQRVDCGNMDPRSYLFPPNTGTTKFALDFFSSFKVAESDDNGLDNLPAFCNKKTDAPPSFQSSDPLIKYDVLYYDVKDGGAFSLLTDNFKFPSAEDPPLTSCPTPINTLEFEYRVFVNCASCGDGVVDDTEIDVGDGKTVKGKDCDFGDYGNFDNSDEGGCSATCRKPFCGDFSVDADEECDDGNIVSGDGCSATCQSEAAVGGVQGDPHFKTWRGHHYDFHGECDLVFLHSSAFASGLGLDVHIRTQIRRDMSFITSAAIRIGTEILEVESQGVYYLNGEYGAALPNKFSGFAFSHTQLTKKQHVFEVYLGGRERIKIKTYNDFVSVLIEQGQIEHFGDSVGLMGDFGRGRMLARDGRTVLDNENEFGQEWQVLVTEPSLFQTPFLPQDNQECTLPSPMVQASQLRRRLSSIDHIAAEEACEHWGDGKADCVFDVLTTGDLEMAMAGAY